MTPEELALCIDLGCCPVGQGPCHFHKAIADQLRAALAEEREACVALLEGLVRQYAKDDEHICPDVVSDVIAAIRTRS